MTRFEKILLWGSTLLVGASGVVYGAMKYFMTTDDPYAVINHPLQPLFLKIHVVSSPLLVFAVGVVFTQHIWKQYRSGVQRSRRSGVWLLMALGPMILSGYLIQAVTGQRVLYWLVAVHLATSIIYLLGFGAHQVVNSLRERARRRRREARATVVPALERRAARESAVSERD
jgi:hypothetical protein